MTTARHNPPTAAAPPARCENRTAIVAGGGRLPVEIAQALRASACEPLVLMIEGEADPALAGYDHLVAPLGKTATFLHILRQRGVKTIVLAGGIRKRPRLRDLRFDTVTLRLLPRIAWSVLNKGDDGLLSAVVAMVERHGFIVRGAHEVAPSLLAKAGHLGRHVPVARDWIDIRAGWRAAKELGALDLGQGAISVGGTIAERERRDGTDAMLARFAAMRQGSEGGVGTGGVLVKCSKPGQELRADLPAIGPDTVMAAVRARLAGIAVEADHALVLDRATMIAEADKAGLFVIAVSAAEIGNE